MGLRGLYGIFTGFIIEEEGHFQKKEDHIPVSIDTYDEAFHRIYFLIFICMLYILITYYKILLTQTRFEKDM